MAPGSMPLDGQPSQSWTVLAVRFALEVFGWAGFGIWGWSLGDGGWQGGLLAGVLVAASMTVWGVLRVPDDPRGKPHPPVRVPGWVRLALELGFFGLAATGLWTSGYRAAAETLLTVTALLYAVTWDRQRWLVRQ